MKPGTSWISRGTWIISAFMVLSLAHLVLHAFTGAGETAGGRTAMTVLAVAGIAAAVGTMAYTGILLGASKGIPFWRSGVVPVVFVVSAMVTGHFAVMLGVAAFGEAAETAAPLRVMALEAMVLVLLEILVVLFFLQGAFRQPDSRESAERILRNQMFLAGYFALGLGAPLVLMFVAYRSLSAGSVVLPVVVGGALLGLIGGLILRQAVLICGALPTLNMAGFEFRRIHRPKEPKPGIGLLPPR